MPSQTPAPQAADLPLPHLNTSASAGRAGKKQLPRLQVIGHETISSILRLLAAQGLDQVEVEVAGRSGLRLLRTDELHIATALGAGARPIRLMAGGFPPRDATASRGEAERTPPQPGPTRRQKKTPMWQQLAPTLAFGISPLRSNR